MAHASKKKIKQKVFESIQGNLIASVMHARAKRDATVLLKELLTDTERIILAKRLAIIAMLIRNYSFTQIQELLEVSPDTVTRIWRQLREGHYPALARYAKNNPRKFEGESLMDLLEKLADVMPPLGRGRWTRIEATLRKGTYD